MFVFSHSSYFILVSNDRHFGDVCHVFECVDQSACSLVVALHDVIATPRATTERKRATRSDNERTAIANGGNTLEKVADDHNNNTVVISTLFSYRLPHFSNTLITF